MLVTGRPAGTLPTPRGQLPDRRRMWAVVPRLVTVVLTVLPTAVAMVVGGIRSRVVPGARGRGPAGPIRFRQLLEDLGPTFTKLGQLIAGRQDLIPAAYRDELAHLRDQATPLPADAVLDVLHRAYGDALDELFPAFALEPVAAGSIGQVHRATTADGRRVAVKIQRPDAAPAVEADLDVLDTMARLVHRLVPVLRRHDLPALVDQFAVSLRQELDYQLEATHGVQIAESLRTFEWVTVPEVIEPLCRPNVLVMEFVDGIPLTDVERLTALGYDRERLASQVVAVNLRLMLFSDVFHADPHAGNYLATVGGGLVVLDFGQTGHSDAATRSQLLELLTALSAGDAVRTGEVVQAMTGAPADESLGEDVSAFVASVAEQPLGSLRMGTMLHDLLGVLHRHHLTLPPAMTMLVKAVFEFESTTEELHADLVLADVVPLALGLGVPAGPPTVRAA